MQSEAEKALPARILLVDDEAVILEILSDFLLMEGHQILTASGGAEALQLLEREQVEMLISDLQMPSMDGLELLEQVKRRFPKVICLIMTGYATLDRATKAIRQGAFGSVIKPFKMEEVVLTVEKGLQAQRLQRENIELKAALSLYRLAAHLGDAVELPPTLQLIVETVAQQTEAQRACLLLFPRDGLEWLGASVGGSPLRVEDLKPQALNLESAIQASEGRAFRYLQDTERTQEVSALLMAPLNSKGERLGLLLALREGEQRFNEGDRKLLTVIADRAAVAVHNAQLFESLERSFRHTIEALVVALEEKDPYTAGHSQRVAEYAQITAQEMGLSEREIELIYQSGRLHDIGKLTVRSEDLNKPSALVGEELSRFRRHPQCGEELLKQIPTFGPILAGVSSHHENYDGSGYPKGLKGEEIPLMARIMAVVDAYDAMTSCRAYRDALEHRIALKELQLYAGVQFDPRCVEAFVLAIRRWRTGQRKAGLSCPL